MSWYGGTADPTPRPVPRNECDFYHLVEGMNDHDAPTGQFSIIMACLIRYCRMKTVVELGVYKGGTTIFLADACRDTDGVCYAIDQEDCHEARERLQRLGLAAPHCYFILGKTTEVPYPVPGKIDLLFIDAGHSYEEFQADWDRWNVFVRRGGWIFVDNTQSNPGVRNYLAVLTAQQEFRDQWNCIICPESYGMAIMRRK